jgi:hypothetical protein
MVYGVWCTVYSTIPASGEAIRALIFDRPHTHHLRRRRRRTRRSRRRNEGGRRNEEG